MAGGVGKAFPAHCPLSSFAFVCAAAEGGGGAKAAKVPCTGSLDAGGCFPTDSTTGLLRVLYFFGDEASF